MDTDTTTNDAKSFLLSRTIWANLLAPPVAWLAARHVAVDADTQAAAITLGIGVMNIVLRTITTRPISLTLPGSTSTASKVLPMLLLCGLLGGGLTGCAGTGSTVTTAQVVAKVQEDWPVVKAALGVYTATPGASPKVTAAIVGGEALLDPEIAQLSALATPISVQSAIDGIATLVTALPTSALNPQVKADIVLLLALAHAGLTIATPAAG